MASKDATFRTDRAGNAILATKLEYYLGIVNMLFNMVPGTDPYNPDMGLNLAQYQFQAGIEGDRDSDYEVKITEQFSKYTDIRISNPIMQFASGGWKVAFQILVDGVAYTALVGYTENTLSVLIQD